MEKTENTPFIWSFVGAGGKTTGMFSVAEYLIRQGYKVLVTTTTHMAIPDDPAFIPGDSAPDIREGLEKHGYVIAGIPLTERKMKGITWETISLAEEAADAILIEADGSARLPFKVPAAHEPVIYPKTSRIFVTEGLTALGKPLADICHRMELFCEMSGLFKDSLLDEAKMAEGIYKGFLLMLEKKYPEASITVILNQADDKESEDAGKKVKQELLGLWEEQKKYNRTDLDIRVLSWRRLRKEGEDLGWLFI